MTGAKEADQGEAESGTPSRSAHGGSLTDEGLSVIGMVAAAVGGGIGVLGFVAFFGAAILWVRMDQAGIPGNEAVAVVPKSVLLTTGANFLVPSLLAALGFTVILYLIETLTELWGNRNLRKLETDLQHREHEAEARQDAAKAATEKAGQAIEQAKEIESIAEKAVGSQLVDEEAVGNLKAAAQQALDSAQQLSREVAPESESESELIRVRREVQEIGAANRIRIEQQQLSIRRVLIATLFLAGAIVTFLVFSVHLRPGRFLVLAILLAGLTTACLAVLTRTESFPWFALTTFVAVGVLSGFLTYYRTVDDPKVEPAAVLRANGAPVYGFFVAQTSDRVYLATWVPAGVIRLDAIPREEVTDLAVAALEPAALTNQLARELALEMCRLARERRSPSVGGEKPTAAGGKPAPAGGDPCTASDLKRLLTGSRNAGGGSA